jgi:hypothetical protein
VTIRRGWLAEWALALLLMLAAAPAAAHLTPNSEVVLSIGADAVTADIIVPQGEYAYATGRPIDGSPRSIALARAYLGDHIAVRGADGRPWRVDVGDAAFVRIAGPPDLHATARFVPPPGARPGAFAIDWRVIVDALPSHFALFVLERRGGGREILGAARTGSTRLAVDRPHETLLTVLVSAIWLGIDHIVSGYDHLAFLLALLLPAPLVAARGRWGAPRPLRPTLSRLAWIVTAFTIGHSITLIGATVWHLSLPTAPVEIAIAASVLFAALHALRPLVPGREPLVAAGFGLVHGLAFATLVQDAGAGMGSSAASLLGFNLGIELVQLAIVAVVVPPLLLLSRRPVYSIVRTVLAALFALAALWWMAVRTVEALA